MPIEVPIGGEVITSAWGKSVADAINALSNAFDTMEPQRYSASAAITLGQGWQDVPGVTVTMTPTIYENWFVIYTMDYDVTVAGAGLLQGVPNLDGVNQAGTAFGSGAAVGRNTITSHTTLFPSVGVPHTLKMSAAKTLAGGAVTLQPTHTRMTVIRIPRNPIALDALNELLSEA